MNVLADFLVRVEEQFPSEIENEELNSLLLTIRNQAAEIAQLKKEVKTLQTNMINDEDTDRNRKLLATESKKPSKKKK